MQFKWLLHLVLIAVGITSSFNSFSYENKFIIHTLLNTVAGFCAAWVIGLWAGITKAINRLVLVVCKYHTIVCNMHTKALY